MGALFSRVKSGFSRIWCHKVLKPAKTWNHPKVQPAAPIETFAPSWLAGLLAGWLAGWAGFSWIFMDFDGFSRIWCHKVPGPGPSRKHPMGGAVAKQRPRQRKHTKNTKLG